MSTRRDLLTPPAVLPRLSLSAQRVDAIQVNELPLIQTARRTQAKEPVCRVLQSAGKNPLGLERPRCISLFYGMPISETRVISWRMEVP